MSLFIVGSGHTSYKEGRVAMLMGDNDISRLLFYVQQFEEEKLKDREEYRNNKANTKNESGQQKNGSNRPSFDK